MAEVEAGEGVAALKAGHAKQENVGGVGMAEVVSKGQRARYCYGQKKVFSTGTSPALSLSNCCASHR